MQDASHLNDSLSDERQFLENLLNTRANFSLVVFGLAIAAVGTLDEAWLQFALLLASGLVSALLAFTISRVQWKVDLTIERLPDEHPAKLIDTIAKAEAPMLPGLMRLAVGKSRRRYIGYLIPWVTAVLLVVAATAAAFGAFQSSEERSFSQRDLDARLLGLQREVGGAHADLSTVRGELRAMRDSVTALRQQVAAVAARR